MFLINHLFYFDEILIPLDLVRSFESLELFAALYFLDDEPKVTL